MSDIPRERILSGNLPSVLWSLAWPLAVSGEMMVISTAIEFFWLGRLLGTSGIATTSLLDPLFLSLLFLLIAPGAGGNILVTQAVGANDGKATTIALSSMILSIFCWAALIGPALPLLSTISEALGGRIGLSAAVYTFLGTWLIFALPSIVLAEIVVESANATGWTRMSVWRVVIDLVFLAGITPVFISWLGLGFAGSALAQAAAAIALIALVVPLLWRRRGELGLGNHVDLGRLVDFRSWRRMLGLGLPPQLARVGQYCFQMILIRFVATESESAVAGYGLAFLFCLMSLTLTLALARATSIVIGQAFGARRPSRARAALRLGSLGALAVMAPVFALSFLGGSVFALISDNPLVIADGERALGIIRYGLFGAAAWQVLIAGCAAAGAPRLASAVTLAVDTGSFCLAFLLPFDSALTAVATAVTIGLFARPLAILAILLRSFGRALETIEEVTGEGTA